MFTPSLRSLIWLPGDSVAAWIASHPGTLIYDQDGTQHGYVWTALVYNALFYSFCLAVFTMPLCGVMGSDLKSCADPGRPAAGLSDVWPFLLAIWDLVFWSLTMAACTFACLIRQHGVKDGKET